MAQSQQVQQMIEAVDQLREVSRGMVAALMSDGFTEEQAREIVVGVFRAGGKR